MLGTTCKLCLVSESFMESYFAAQSQTLNNVCKRIARNLHCQFIRMAISGLLNSAIYPARLLW